jgi:hypothetical protein
MLTFIHIGKTGGTTIQKILNLKQYHLIKNYNLKNKFIIWVRNPIARFVSAFNMSYINVNFKKFIKNTNDLGCKNVLLKRRIDWFLSKKNNFIFSQRYDTLINFFKTPNNLAEGLSSDNKLTRKKAEELMNHNTLGHIYRGIGWYLNNGKFVKNHNNKIFFVGKQETMNEDIEKLGILLKKKIVDNKSRVNNYSTEESKYLSPLAIENIIRFYKDTDYAALIELNKHGWISNDILESYYTYP